MLDHLDHSSPDALNLNDFSIRTHFNHVTQCFLESFVDQYWTFDVKQPSLTRAFAEKDFLKSIDKNNKFCRQFMDGKVDKTRELYKKFV